MDYLEFCSSVRFNLSWNSLKYKYEYTIDSSEFSLYQLLADQTPILALNLHLNHLLCEALSRVHGFIFANNNNASINAIKEYFKINNIDIDIDSLKIIILKEKISHIKNLADEKFYELVEEMFSNNLKTKEVKLVVYCHRIIKALQPLKNTDLKLYYKLVDEATLELKEKCLEVNDIVDIDLSKYIPSNMEPFKYEFLKEEKEAYFKNISETIKYYTEKYPDQSFENIIKYTISSLLNE